jgi:transcriptional regulator with XRE-family HTH domain
MNDTQTGRIVRMVRRRRHLSQTQLASLARVSQATTSRIERGHLDLVSLRTLRSVFTVLEVRLELLATWRGPDLDRLLDEDHAVLVGIVAGLLERHGWDVAVEVTYSHFGERGSIDILAAHRASGVTLVVEIKTQLVSVESTLRRLDQKARLGGGLAAERFGRRSANVARILVLPDRSTERRRVARHRDVLARSLPVQDGRSIRRWLGNPVGTIEGVWFVSVSHPRTRRRADPSESAQPGARQSRDD